MARLQGTDYRGVSPRSPSLPITPVPAMPSALGTSRAVLALTVLAITPLAQAAAPQNLAAVYAGNLDYDKDRGAVDWVVEASDVWRLSSFEYALPDQLELSFGPSTVVIAKNVSDTTCHCAVWGALFPDEPTKIVSSEPGHGSHAKAIFLRFNPQMVGELIPEATVEGRGDPNWLIWAKEQYGYKISGTWQWDNMPVVPWQKSLIFDIDTVEGDRRFYAVDTEKETVKYEPAFVGRVIEETFHGEPLGKAGIKTYKAAWQAFDKEYAMFTVKPDVDWKKLYKVYEPLAARARSGHELAGVIGLLLTHLEDLHITVRQDGRWVPTYNRFRVTNGNWNAVKRAVGEVDEDADLHYGRIEGADGAEYGYIMVGKLQQERMGKAFDGALTELADTTGLIIDVRFNGGGNEILGRRMASRFLDQKVVYSQSRYRKGKRRDSLTKPFDRECEPRGPWRYSAPVVVLQGEKTMSSAESFVLMLAQAPNVTTMGDRTAGSSANPRMLELDHDIVIRLPRWLDLPPDGQPIDRVGVAPDVQLDFVRPGQFKRKDPVFEAAVEHLVALGNTEPGKPAK